ncbi:MAG: hypothetical protein DRH17_14200 [Deltaproteobacteria bacterium]|nr:MAG: hypothetical protein DRH17_14200 [Deltaproteobacteria bacterium]
MPRDVSEWVEKLKEELNEYQIGEYELGQIFEPLIMACAKVAKTENELRQCVNEGISTLKSVVRKVR